MLLAREHSSASGRQSMLEGAAMLASLQAAQQRAAGSTVAWFVENMPESYFREVPQDVQVRHMNAVATLFPQSAFKEGRRFEPFAVGGLERVSLIEESSATFLTPRDEPGLLSDLLEVLAKTPLGSRDLRAVGCYTSDDSALAISTFDFEHEGVGLPPSPPEVEERLARLGLDGDDGVGVTVSHSDSDPDRHQLSVMGLNFITRLGLQRLSSYLGQRGLNIESVSMDSFCRGDKGEVQTIEIGVQALTERKRGWEVLCSEAARAVKWVDDRTLQLGAEKGLTLIEAEVVHALASMQHGRLAKRDPFAFALSRLYQIVESEQALPTAHAIARLVLDRFNPDSPLSESAYRSRYNEVAAEVASVSPADVREVLSGMLDAADSVLRTNAYAPNRFALSLRLKPECMGFGTVGTATPYGTFFVSGRRFRGFHVRFRDIARGGLRVVTPPSAEAHAIESSRQYDEVYNLSYAQQLKNKDIPEGGAKAVVLLEPDESDDLIPDKYGRSFMARKSVRAFTDALLDLLIPDERMADLLGRDELVYLGPDEQIIPADIEWITARAALRGYPNSNAFMSSKPSAGINHKVYGVTSEGVAVFLGKALEALKAEAAERGEAPKDFFTVKITGGTDGDVAGNMLKILHRDYGEGVRLLGICDGTASVEDPDGVPMAELLRLVREQLPLCEFNPKAFTSSGGSLHLASTPEGARMRDTMHERVEADAFMPAGGRPNTIDISNWERFLKADGTPSSPLICEAANLFITPDAREALHGAGAVVIKDSSANKCGVICSSYEIIASMMLSEGEFLECKQELVEDVLERLRDKADAEAGLLFRERARDPSVPLPNVSERISSAITAVHDATLEALEAENGLSAEAEEALVRLSAERHLPAVLATPEMLDRLVERVPQSYKRNIVAATAAATLVYEQGLVFAEGLGHEVLHKAATKHLEALKRVATLAARVADGATLNDAEAKEIATLLRAGGARSAIELNITS